MFDFGVSVLAAFFLYVVLLPLLGALAGAVIYLGMPYVAGIAIASIAHKLLHGSYLDMGVFWGFAVIWAIALVYIRNNHSKLADYQHSWYEGHYLAAKTIFLLGRPYRRQKRALAS